MSPKFTTPVILFVIAALMIVLSVAWNESAKEQYQKAWWASNNSGVKSAKQQMQTSRVLTYVGGVGVAAGVLWVVVVVGSKKE